MSPTLRRYLMRLYLGSVALCALGVLSIFLVIDFGDRLKLYVGHRASDVVELYVAKTCVTVGQLMPLAMLLGAGLALTVLARRGELRAMKALGISPAGIVAPLLLCAVPLGVGLMAFDEWVAGPASARVDRLMIDRFGIWGDARYYYGAQQWLRLGPDVFRLTPYGVTVFQLAPDFSLARRTDAKTMTPLPGGGFELTAVRARDYAEAAAHQRTAEREEARFPNADGRAFSIRPGRPEQMSSVELSEQLALRRNAGLPVTRLQLARHGRFSYPLLGAVGALLAAGLALRRGRTAALTVALVEGLGVSAAMWGLLVVGRALALSERVPPFVAAWGPLLALAALGAALLSRRQVSG
ncbi:MAG: LptF/LptG family permease [Archangiaceae bacterium]|nr:LptF/LptG family permease [Archangiaceae bacterium]